MTKTTFKVSLKDIHAKSGLSAYAVAKRSGVTQKTTSKYAFSDSFYVDTIHTSLVDVCNVYGVDWKDVVESVEYLPEE